MSKRQSIYRYDSSEVQGEGSFVVITAVKVHEIREFRQDKADGKTQDTFIFGIDMLQKHVIDWNWVGDDGEPLPNPAEHPEVVEDLTDKEVAFLADVFIKGGTETELKN